MASAIVDETLKVRAQVVSAGAAGTKLSRLLSEVEDSGRSLIIERRGTPTAILLSLSDYVKLAAPEPEVLRLIGEESVRNGTDQLSDDQIDQIIHAARAKRKKL
jgi:prevent-host-death family protein